MPHHVSALLIGSSTVALLLLFSCDSSKVHPKMKVSIVFILLFHSLAGTTTAHTSKKNGKRRKGGKKFGRKACKGGKKGKKCTPSQPFDINGDGNVDLDDLDYVARTISDPFGILPQGDLVADANGDGVVDLEDARSTVNHLISLLGAEALAPLNDASMQSLRSKLFLVICRLVDSPHPEDLQRVLALILFVHGLRTGSIMTQQFFKFLDMTLLIGLSG